MGVASNCMNTHRTPPLANTLQHSKALHDTQHSDTTRPSVHVTLNEHSYRIGDKLSLATYGVSKNGIHSGDPFFLAPFDLSLALMLLNIPATTSLQ